MENNQILKELNACATLCNMCFNGCLNERDVTIFARCIELNRECADFCQLTASALTRDSENIDKYLSMCAELCQLCADECEKHTNNHCKKCAEVCLTCAEICLSVEMASKI